MNNRRNIKKILIITAIALITVILIAFAVWFAIYKSSTGITNYDALKNALSESDSKLSGFIWVDTLEYKDNTVSFNLYPSKERVVIPIDKVKFEHPALVLIGDNSNSPSLIYLSFEYSNDDGCPSFISFICNNGSSFKKMTLYNSIHMVVNLEYEVFEKAVYDNIEHLITEYSVGNEDLYTKPSSLLTEYVYLSKFDGENNRLSDVRSELLNQHLSLGLYLSGGKFLDKENVAYLQITDSICSESFPDDTLNVFSKLVLNELCGSTYEISDTEILTILQPEIKEDLLMSDFVLNSMYIYYLYESTSDIGIVAQSNIRDFIQQGFLLGKHTPYCTPNPTIFCTRDFLLNMLLFLEIKNENSI